MAFTRRNFYCSTDDSEDDIVVNFRGHGAGDYGPCLLE